MFFFFDGSVQAFVRGAVSGIDPVVTDHFKILFRDVLSEAGDKIKGRNGFHDEFFIFMAVVMEGDRITIVRINPGSGDGGPAQITANIFDYVGRITTIGHGTDIETVFMVGINGGLHLFERMANTVMQFIQKCCLKGIAQKGIVKMLYMPPEKGTANPSFCNEAMDMGVPFQVPSKGMKDADEARGEELGFIHFMEHACHNIINSREKTVEEGTVLKKKRAQFIRNGKHTVPVDNIDKFKRHGSGSVNGVHVAAGGAKAGMATEGNKFIVAAGGAGIHGTAKGRITAMNHFFYIFNDRITGMLDIKHFFKMVSKNLL